MSTAEFFFDESIRVDHIIWLAAQGDQPSDEVEEFFENAEPKLVARLWGIPVAQAKKILAQHEDSSQFESGALSTLYIHTRKTGFLVAVSTPVPTKFFDDGFQSYGFGFFTTEWFYTEAFDDAFVKSLGDWKKAFIAEKRAEDKRKNKKVRSARSQQPAEGGKETP